MRHSLGHMRGGGDFWDQPVEGVLSAKWDWDSYAAWSTFLRNAGFLGPFPRWQSSAPGSGDPLQPHQDGQTLLQHALTGGDQHTPPSLGTGTLAGLLL